MDFVFLGARLPLTKTFVARDGLIASTPYPHVSKVTSYHESAKDLAGFADLLRAHAAKDHCLFNGQLTTPLNQESRANKTAKTTKPWIVFDFDKVEATDAADAIARYLPACCQGVSYIVQLSASMFRPDTTTWSGHVFMLLDAPTEEQHLKQWFEWINFNVPALEQQIKLSDSHQALHWPLDRTVAYNSKLIYIAAPKCHHFKPAIDQHITLVKKKKPTLSIPAFNPIDSITVRTKINALRRALGEDEIAYDIVTMNGMEVLRTAGGCNIHDVKASGDHYLRFNLNGGDSYAYFIDLRAPELIRNFKGEPFLKTEDVAPEFYKKLKKVAFRATGKQPLDDGAEVLAFYDTMRNSQIRIGTWLPTTRTLTMHAASETPARAWLAEYGLFTGYFPHMNVVFDPFNDHQYIPGDTTINTFRASDYMLQAKDPKRRSALGDVPRTIDKLLRSLLGSPTDEVYSHFLNWLAYVFQTRRKTGTAWVFSGVEGTGKGSFVQFLLKPLFGDEQVRVVQFGLLTQEFNAFLENALFVVFDEADSKAVPNSEALMMKLRHYITDSPIEIRKMRTDPYSAPSYTNFIFNSNQRTPVVVGTKDRRFNIPERQEARLFFTPNEILSLKNGDELESFASVLRHWPVDEARVIRLIDTQARADVHEATTSINQQVADAIVNGDLQFLVDRMPSDAIAAADFYGRINPIGLFKAKLDQFMEHAAASEPMYLTADDLYPVFRTLISDTRFFQDSKTWCLRHYKALGLHTDKQHKLASGKKARGVRVLWKQPLVDGVAFDLPNNVTPIKGKKK